MRVSHSRQTFFISVAASATTAAVVAVAAEAVCAAVTTGASVVAVHKQKNESYDDEPNDGVIKKIAQAVHFLTVPFRDFIYGMP